MELSQWIRVKARLEFASFCPRPTPGINHMGVYRSVKILTSPGIWNLENLSFSSCYHATSQLSGLLQPSF